jgi:hypothetical protein
MFDNWPVVESQNYTVTGTIMEHFERERPNRRDQWFHILKSPLSLHAYREVPSDDEPVAFVWRGRARPFELEQFMHRAEAPGSRTYIHAFSEDSEAPRIISMSRWRLDNYPALAGVKFMRLESFRHGRFFESKKPDLAVWAPVDMDRLNDPVESNIGALIPSLPREDLLFRLADLMVQTSVEVDRNISATIQRALDNFFHQLWSNSKNNREHDKDF